MVALNWKRARKVGAFKPNYDAKSLEKQATALIKAADAQPGPEAQRAIALARKLRKRKKQLAAQDRLAKLGQKRAARRWRRRHK